MNKIEIMDYRGRKSEVVIENIDNVKKMYITVVTGDEILTVEYKDGSKETYDSCDDRVYGFYDYDYDVFNDEEKINLLDDPKFINRKDSYSLE